MAQGRKLEKAVYVLSIDKEGAKVVHANYIPSSLKAKGGDARTWAARITEILGGKVNSNIAWIIFPIDQHIHKDRREGRQRPRSGSRCYAS